MPLPELLEALARSNEEELAGLLAAAREEAETVLAAARAEANERLGQTLEAERVRLHETGERRRVAARRDSAARILRARAALLDRVFEAARTRTASVRGWPGYPAWLQSALGRVRELLGPDPGTLRCAPEDAARAQAWAQGSALSVEPAAEVAAGLLCLADGGRLSVDLTLPVRLRLERPALSIALAPALEDAR